MDLKDKIPAEVFPPGEFIRDELDARGWSQADFALIIARDTGLVSDIVSAKRGITPETASAIGQAFGTGGQVWMNLESEYRLHLAEKNRPAENSIASRARLFTEYPIRLMIKRGWIEPSDNVEVLESRSKEFFSPKIAFAAKMVRQEDKAPLQLAWLYRVYNTATRFPVGKYSEDKLQASLIRLRNLMQERLEIRHIPSILNSAGIRFLIVEALPSSRIDGVCFWLDNKSPVVALSLRGDRIDNFWFTLIHELKHVEHRHGLDRIFLDTDIMQNIQNETIPEEIRVNRETQEFLVPKQELEDFAIRVRPFFSALKIMAFAKRLGVHPGIVVGQLKHFGIIDWNQHSKFHEKIRDILTEIAICDGWGNSIH